VVRDDPPEVVGSRDGVEDVLLVPEALSQRDRDLRARVEIDAGNEGQLVDEVLRLRAHDAVQQLAVPGAGETDHRLDAPGERGHDRRVPAARAPGWRAPLRARRGHAIDRLRDPVAVGVETDRGAEASVVHEGGLLARREGKRGYAAEERHGLLVEGAEE